MRKFIWFLVLVVVLATAGAVYFAYSHMDRLAKGVIEEAGSKALGVPVRVQSVDIQLAKRQVTLWGLTVANPPGYSKKAALSFGSLFVQMSGFKGDVKRLVAVDPVFRVELKGSGSNLSQLQAWAQRAGGGRSTAGGGGPSPGGGGPSPAGGSPGRGKVIKVETLKVTGGQAILTGPNLKEPMHIGVRNLELHGLKGTPQQIAGQVVGRLLGITMQKAASVAAKRGLGKLMNKGGQGVTDLMQKLGGAKQ